MTGMSIDGSGDRGGPLNRVFRHRITRNAGALSIVQLVNYLVPFAVLVYLTRTLGVETYGVVAFSIGIVQLAIVVLDLGFTLSATQKISVSRDRPERVSRFIGGIFVLKAAAFTVVAMALVAYAMTTTKYSDYSALFLVILLPIFAHCFQPIWLFAAIERMGFIAAFTVLAKLCSLVLIMYLVREEADYLWVPVADGCAQAIALIVSIWFVYRVRFRISFPDRRVIAHAWRLTAGYFVSRLAATAYLSTGIVLLGLFSTPAAVAIYALAEQGYRAMQSVFFPVVQAVYPYMARERDVALLCKVAVGSVLAAFGGAIALYFFLPSLINLLFGPGWDGVVSVMNVFLVAITIHVMAIMSGHPLAISLRRARVANVSVVYGALLYAVLAGVLISTGRATPITFAILVVTAETCVLAYRAVLLWPLALSELKRGRQ